MRFGYARVSTQYQSVDMQVDALERYGVDRIYRDAAKSGRRYSRPAFDEMMEQLREGDAVVVYKLDRLGRTTKGLIELATEMEERGVDLISITESIDTSTPSGRFLFTMLAAISEMEADLVSERVNEGLRAARARGRCGGRPPKPKEDVELALTMYDSEKYTLKQICDKVDMSKTTLYRYLEQRAACDSVSDDGSRENTDI